MNVKTYRVKAPEVEAIQFDGSAASADLITYWMMVREGNAEHWSTATDGNADRVFIYTPRGVVSAREGDWIVRGPSGDFYPCAAGAFAATYEEVAE